MKIRILNRKDKALTEGAAETEAAEGLESLSKDHESRGNMNDKDGMGRKIYRLILSVFVIAGMSVAAFSLIMLAAEWIGYARSRAFYNRTKADFTGRIQSGGFMDVEVVSGNGKGGKKDTRYLSDSLSSNTIDVDLAALKKINPEVIGWIYFEDGEISYPLLYSGDNEKYLRRNYKDGYMSAGSIFLDGAGNPDMSDRHTMIYGHNMRDLSMFGKLRYYRKDNEYYKTHKYFQIILPDETYRYEIFSCKQVPYDSDLYKVLDKDSDELEEFAKAYITRNSIINNTGVTITDDDHIITLSTCVSNDEYRFIVCGKRL